MKEVQIHLNLVILKHNPTKNLKWYTLQPTYSDTAYCRPTLLLEVQKTCVCAVKYNLLLNLGKLQVKCSGCNLNFLCRGQTEFKQRCLNQTNQQIKFFFSKITLLFEVTNLCRLELLDLIVPVLPIPTWPDPSPDLRLASGPLHPSWSLWCLEDPRTQSDDLTKPDDWRPS